MKIFIIYKSVFVFDIYLLYLFIFFSLSIVLYVFNFFLFHFHLNACLFILFCISSYIHDSFCDWAANQFQSAQIAFLPTPTARITSDPYLETHLCCFNVNSAKFCQRASFSRQGECKQYKARIRLVSISYYRHNLIDYFGLFVRE